MIGKNNKILAIVLFGISGILLTVALIGLGIYN